MLLPAPPMPDFPPANTATTTSHLRYEDVAQDGRLMPIAMPHQLGGMWDEVLSKHPGARNSLSQGIIPILTRLTMESFDPPIRVDKPVVSRSGFELARDDGAGDPERLFLLAWAETHGMGGRMGPVQPDGPPTLAGRLFAEHTFTRPFATPDFRRVTKLAAEGYPEVPERRYPVPDTSSAGDAPAGATWQGELYEDPTPIVFTLDQTDSNQHVNSLVYIRMFLDAVQRRLAAGNAPLRVRSRAIDIAYRKPCFAGDQVRAHLRWFALPSGLRGAAGFLAAPGDAKPRCYVRTILTP